MQPNHRSTRAAKAMAATARASTATRSVAVLCIILCVAAPAHATNTMDVQAQNLFNSLGAVGNVTSPQAFKGQTMNTFTGGSLYYRAPQNNYQLASLQLPYIRGGCGGIDIFAGAFSFISSAQLKAMMQSITSAIPGVLFDLALKSVEPLLGDSVQQFQGIANFINNRNLNSCQAAKSLISSVGTELGMSTNSSCKTIALDMGIASDATDAELKCKSNSGVSGILNGATGTSSAPLKPFSGNLVWAALQRLAHLDNDERTLIMSITGTTIYPDATDNNTEPQSYPPTITDANQLLVGDASAGGASNMIALNILNCNGDLTNCLITPGNTTTTSTMQSLTDRVGGLMRSISGKIQSRTALATADANFVNNVPMPVYKMLASSNTINNSAISDTVINAFQEYVAIEYARSLLARLAQEGVNSGGLTAQLSSLQREQLKIHIDNARALLARLDSRSQQAAQAAGAYTSIAAHIETLQRTLRAAMPQQVADLLAYSNAGVGR